MEDIQETLYNETFLPGLKRILPAYGRLLKKSGSGYVVSSGLTYVDFFIADFLHTLKLHEPKLFKEYPTCLRMWDGCTRRIRTCGSMSG